MIVYRQIESMLNVAKRWCTLFSQIDLLRRRYFLNLQVLKELLLVLFLLLLVHT